MNRLAQLRDQRLQYFSQSAGVIAEQTETQPVKVGGRPAVHDLEKNPPRENQCDAGKNRKNKLRDPPFGYAQRKGEQGEHSPQNYTFRLNPWQQGATRGEQE